MIKTARIPRNLSGVGFAAVSALAVALLPLAPTRAQVANDPAAKPENVAVEAPVFPPNPEPVKPADPTITPVAHVAGGPGASDFVEVIGELKSPGEGNKSLPVAADTDPFVAKNYKIAAARDAARAEVDKLTRQLQRAQQRLAELDAAAFDDFKRNPKPETYSPDQPKSDWKYPVPAARPPYDEKGKYDSKTNGPKPGDYGNFRNKTPNDPNARERRLDQVEANLKALLDEVRALRNEQSSPGAPGTPPAPR